MIVVLVLNILICFGIPLGYVVYTKSKGYSMKPFFIGMLTFFVSQILLRLPILDFFTRGNLFSVNYPILYIIILCFSAGLFEEGGRYIAFTKLLKNKRSWRDGLSFGVGHAGMEAIILVGLSRVSMLMAILNTNGVESEKIIETIKASASEMELFISGIERVFAGGFHIVASIAIIYGIVKGIKYLLPLMMVLHGVVNLVACLIMPNIILAETWLCVVFIIALIYIIKFKKLFKKEVLAA